MKTTLILLPLSLLYITISIVAAAGSAPRPSTTTTTTNVVATLPFDTLPNSHCSVPAVCGQLNGAKIQCRCDDTVTVCYNEKRQYCWGSSTLRQNTGCPAMPDICRSRFNSTVSCLCNTSNVLCVDQYSHACYGSIQGTNVSLLPLGGLAPPSSSSSSVISSTSSSMKASSTSSGSQSKGTMAATSTPIPNHASRLSPFLLPLVYPFLHIIIPFTLF